MGDCEMNLKNYIGTKRVEAQKMTRNEFAIMHGDQTDDREDIAGYMVRYQDGYESWSPKDVFEEAYRVVIGLNFGLALEAAKKGAKISRRGWNGKNQYVFLVDNLEFHTNADLSDLADQDVEVHDALAIKTTSGVIQVGWLASQSDMLADDWVIVG